MDVRPSPPSYAQLTIASLFVILVSAAGAFVGLDASSLWADELFTAYFSDPTDKNFQAALDRASEGVNPPFYYILLREVLRSTGLSFVIGSRGLSALLGCLALIAVILAPARPVGLTPRLFAAAFAATSPVWFDQTQEARAYALAILLLTAAAACAVHSICPLRSGKIPFATLSGLAVFSLGASLSQYYAILPVGALFTILLTFCRSKRAVVGVVAFGASVLLLFIPVMVWHQSHMIVDVSKTWHTAPEFAETRFGTIGWLTERFGDWRTGLLLLALLAATAGRVGQFTRTIYASPIRDALILLIGCLLLAYLYAIAVSLAYIPMLSSRFFNFFAPMTWIAMAYLVHAVLSVAAGINRDTTASMLLSLAILASGTKIQNRGQDGKQPWRQTAEVVAELPGCIDGQLPVIWWDQQFMSDDDPEWFYGFYLEPHPKRTWLPLRRDRVLESLDSPEMASLIRDTVEGRRTCPLLLWSVHMSAESLAAVARALEAKAGVPITVSLHRPRYSKDHGTLFLLE